MPYSPNFNLEFRPKSYFEPDNPTAELLARIKGTARRTLCKELINAGAVNDLHPSVLKDNLDDDERQAVGAIHPLLMGGEYLPPLEDHEIEIARVSLLSTTGDVISLRAQRHLNGICYRFVDEYAEEPDLEYKTPQLTTQLPLTFGELLNFIENTEVFEIDGEQLGTNVGTLWRDWNYLKGDSSPADLVDFVSVTSEFYPELERWYAETAIEWCRKEQKKERRSASKKRNNAPKERRTDCQQLCLSFQKDDGQSI